MDGKQALFHNWIDWSIDQFPGHNWTKTHLSTDIIFT